MEICLHVGAHRTGTTSFQTFLRHNRDSLTDAGTYVIDRSRVRAGLLRGVLRNPDRTTAQADDLASRAHGRFQIECQRLAGQGARHLIVTEENLLGSMAHNLRHATLYGQAGARLTRMAPALRPAYPLTIGLCIRSYHSHWASQLAFQIRAGGGLPARDHLDRLTTQPRRWRDVIADLASVCPQARIVVWPFESWVDRPAPLLCALTRSEQPARRGRASGSHNASIPVEVMRTQLAQSGNRSAAKQLAGLDGRYQPFPRLHREKLHQDYCKDIAWLEAGADGLADYLHPTGDTPGGSDMTRGRPHEFEIPRLARAG